MLKRLGIFILAILLAVPAMAQPKESCECNFGPKKGQWEVAINLGQGQFFNDGNGLFYLLPKEDGSAIGLGKNEATTLESGTTGNAYISGDASTLVLITGSLNANSLVNIAGINAKYFFTDHLAITFGGAYNANLQPGKDYVEGENVDITTKGSTVTTYDPSVVNNNVGIDGVYGQKAVLGAVTHSGIANLGLDYYFRIAKAPRVTPYIGAFGQFKIGRISSYYPYTGQTILTDIAGTGQGSADLKYEDADIYRNNRVGQAMGIVGGFNFGVDFSLMENLIIGIQVAPVAYQYTLLHLQVVGQDPYLVTNHNIRAFTYPQLKFGFRF